MCLRLVIVPSTLFLFPARTHVRQSTWQIQWMRQPGRRCLDLEPRNISFCWYVTLPKGFLDSSVKQNASQFVSWLWINCALITVRLSSVAVSGGGCLFVKLLGARLPLLYQRASGVSDKEYLDMTDINNKFLCSLKNHNTKFGKEYRKCPQWKSKTLNHAVSLQRTNTQEE